MKKRLAAHITSMLEHDRDVVLGFDPRLIDAFDAFECASGTRTRNVLRRAADLIKWLTRVPPHSIQELGSGRSSLVFALWAKRHEIPYVAFEQSPDWSALTTAAIEHLGGAGKIACTPVMCVGQLGNRFEPNMDDEIDFIYLDGPHGNWAFGGRGINFDVAHHLARGCRPRTILVDGRHHTYRHLMTLPTVKEYDVALQFKPWPEFVDENEIRRHTSLVLRQS